MKLNLVEVVVLYVLVITCLLYFVYMLSSNFKAIVKKLNWKFDSGHILILGLDRIGYRFAKDLLENGRKVVVVSEGGNGTYEDQIRSAGGKVILTNSINEATIKKGSLSKASKVIIVTGSDERNIAVTNFISKRFKIGRSAKALQILVHVSNWDSKSLLSDYGNKYSSVKNIHLRAFDTDQESARLIFDRFPPFRYVNDETTRNKEKSICVIGLNKIAEAFIIENSILSHFLGTERLTVFVLERNAKEEVKQILYRFPYIDKFLDLRPVELQNSFFDGTEKWAGNFVENIGNVDVAYCFGDEDAKVVNVAVHFKQFLYNNLANVRKVPVIACLPEKTEVFELLEVNEGKSKQDSILRVFNDDLMIHPIRKYADTLDVSRLIDSNDSIETLAKAVNYFYSIKYEFDHILNTQFKKNSNHQFIEALQSKYLNFAIKAYSPMQQLEGMVIQAVMGYTKSSEFRVKNFFSVEARWGSISERSKDSNRYVARDVDAKVHMLKELGAREITTEYIDENAYKLFSLVHKRWMAEKNSAHFSYGPMPTNNNEFKKLLRNTLKVHDMLIPYSELSQHEKDKDKDMFMLIPIMLKIRKGLSS